MNLDGIDYKAIQDKVQLSTEMRLDLKDSEYIKSQSVFTKSGQISFHSILRRKKSNGPARPQNVVLKIKYSSNAVKDRGNGASMLGFDLRFDDLVDLFNALKMDPDLRYRHLHHGKTEDSRHEINLTAVDDKLMFSIRNADYEHSMLLNTGQVAQLKMVVFSCFQLYWFDIEDSVILSMIEGLTAKNTAASQHRTTEAISFEKVPHNLSELSVYIGQQSSGSPIRPGTRRALWAIGNQHFAGDIEVMERIKVIQQYASESYAASLIEPFNSGDRSKLESVLILKESL